MLTVPLTFPLHHHCYHRYKAGDTVTVKADAMMGRATDLVFKLVADDFMMMCMQCPMGMSSDEGSVTCTTTTSCRAKSYPVMMISSTPNALAASAGTGTAGLKAPIADTVNKYISSSSITTTGTGQQLSFMYTSTSDAITSITAQAVMAASTSGGEYVSDRIEVRE